MRRADSLVKTLMLGKIEGRRRRGQQRKRCLDGIANSMDMGLGELRKLVMDREAWCGALHGVTENQTWLTNRNWLPLSLSVETSPSVLPFVSASLNLSASIIYYGFEGVILSGSIIVQSVPYSAGGWGGGVAGFDRPQATSFLRVCQHIWLGSSVVPGLKPDVRPRLPFPQWLSLSYWGQGSHMALLSSWESQCSPYPCPSSSLPCSFDNS